MSSVCVCVCVCARARVRACVCTCVQVYDGCSRRLLCDFTANTHPVTAICFSNEMNR